MLKYLIGATLLLGALYGAVQVWPLVIGPTISILSPEENAVIPGGIAIVQGSAAHIVRLTLNGAAVLYDQNGTFSSTLTFPRGGSILTFEAVDRFGRKKTITRSLFVP